MKKTTYLETLMHCVKGMLGAGIFSMGVAFKNAGIVVSLVFAPLVAIMVLHCVHMLIEAIEIAKKHHEEELAAKKSHCKEAAEDKDTEDESHALSYAIVVRIILNESQWKSMSKFTGILYVLVQTAICVMYIGFCSLYVVFVGRNMSDVLASFDIEIDMHYLMAIFTVPMWILSMIPNLKALSLVSTTANILLMISFGISYYYIFGQISFPNKVFDVSYVGDWEQIPLFFGVALFSFEMVALIFPLRHEMQKPDQLTSKFGVLNIGFLIVSFFIIFMGTVSYLAYGNNLADTVFGDFPKDEILARTVLIVVCCQVILTYPLQLYVPVKIIWNAILNNYGTFKYPTLMETFLRTILISITGNSMVGFHLKYFEMKMTRVAIGESIPFVDLLISLIGSVCSTSLTIFLPPLLNIVIRYPKLTTTTQKVILIIKNVVIMIIATVIFFSGMISSIRDIVKELQ